MGVITPNAGLILTSVILGLFGILMMVAPKWMMDQYSVDSSKWNQTEKLMVIGFFQFIGVNYGFGVAAGTVTFRNGTDDQKSMLCAVSGGIFILFSIVALSTTSSWTDLGVPASGGYFNAGLCFVVAIVNFLGVSKAEAKLVNLKAPIFWGFVASIVIYTLYMFGFAFFAESLGKSYGVELSGNAKGVMENLMKFNYAPWLLYVILIFVLQIAVPGPLSTYVYARYVGFLNMAFGLIYLVCAAIWTNLDVQDATGFTSSAKDKIVSGQLFNAALYFFFFILFYVPLTRLDASIKDVVEKELAAPAKKAKKKAAAAEPAAAPAAAGEPVVEPLLPPPRPLMPLASSSTLIPSYSMVAAPQMAYGSQPQYYAAPATTAYAAPATTAYATPMPQYTYAAAAPATAGYAPVATTGYAAPVTVATTA